MACVKSNQNELYACQMQSCNIPLQFSEVSLRNSIHRRLTVLYGNNWFDQPKFTGIIPDRHKDEITKVVADERKRRGSSFTTDHVVAGMSFGFWQNLLGGKLRHYPRPTQRALNFGNKLVIKMQ